MLNSALITQSCFSLKHLSFDPTVGSRTIGWILLSLLHWAVIVSSCRKCFPLTWSSYLLGVWMAEPEPAELLRETDTGKGCRVVCKDGWSGVGGCWLTSPMWQIWWRCISVLLFFSFYFHPQRDWAESEQFPSSISDKLSVQIKLLNVIIYKNHKKTLFLPLWVHSFSFEATQILMYSM